MQVHLPLLGAAVTQQLLSCGGGLCGSAHWSHPHQQALRTPSGSKPPAWGVLPMKRGDGATHLLCTLVEVGFGIKAQLV